LLFGDKYSGGAGAGRRNFGEGSYSKKKKGACSEVPATDGVEG